MRTTSLCVGDRIDISDTRKVIVEAIDEAAIHVVWFTPQGVGPFRCALPHAELQHQQFEDERLGQHKSYFKTHADFTGKNGEI